ncbi:hypothetical protein F5Y12DRAFT_741485 [Xylaria sp. FL1777]|nr:hypothetical protein F5Y12DRAFT_741485 [Xylaria sp. FL1777]
MARNPRTSTRTLKLVSQKGWRRTVIINVVLACTCGLTLLIFLVVSLSQPGASFSRPGIIFNGSCTTSSRLNLLLHFLINVISTAVLSSSNFLMQILNAPTRREIDSAHTFLQSLDIGIPSIRNLPHVSRLKSVSWLVFLITSIPIHILFNSAIFETTFEGSHWHLTFATEAFTQGAQYFPPGASLLPAGKFSPTHARNGSVETGGYGEAVPVEQYWDASSVVRQNLASVAEESHSWTLLSAAQCQSEYVSCNPRRKYGDVVLVLDSTASEEGWKRSDIFNFDPSSNLSTSWDTHVPPNAVNSLWFSTQCTTTRQKSDTGRGDYCANSCLGAMGLDEYGFFLSQTLQTTQEPWLITFFAAVRQHNQSLFDEGLTLNDKFDSLRVDHCLAQPNPQTCKVGLSNALLLIVIISILVKAIQGAVIVWKLPSASLVTPGDAIESFISHPDSITQGLGTLDIADAQEIEFGKRRHWSDALSLGITTKVQPRRWKKPLRRLRHIIPYVTWVKTYAILFAGAGLLTTGFVASSEATQNNYSESLDRSNGVLTADLWNTAQTPGYIALLLLANTPQLILSLCYFSYNSFLTQFHVEKEWNAFSVSYKPLRVSYPAGQQTSTYRLQLPYRYSVPLILISITLHWLVSNAVFLYVNEGGYWTGSDSLIGLDNEFSVSDDSLIAIGYSPLFFLLLFIASFLFIICPPVLLGFSKMKGNMVAGGWNSLVISAACHVPGMEDTKDEKPYSNEADNYLNECPQTDYVEVPIAPEEDEANDEKLLDLTRRKLRWGAMEFPKRLAESTSGEGQAVSHLGFGGEEHDISEPKEGQYYL